MAKITFVYPDFESLGLEYLMAICMKAGHNVDLILYHAEDLVLGFKSNNINYKQIAREIVDTKPDIVAFSCVTDIYRYQLSCSEELKKISTDTITIFGGIHPTAVPEKVLKNEAVDCVAIGEGEISFVEFINECDKNQPFALPNKSVEGIVFKQNNEIIGDFIKGPLPNLNDLPFPYKEPFYSNMKDTAYEYRILTSRGCPFNCIYCFNSYFNKIYGTVNAIRQRTVDNVILELRHAKQHYNVKYIFFLDDCFTASKKWILEFCDRYKNEISLPFTCTTNPIYIDKNVAAALANAGCMFIQLGIQSLSEEICKKVNRRSNNTKIISAINDLKDAGIMVQIDHLLGLPGDTIDIQEQNVLYYNEIRPNRISVYWLTYYPKCEIIETLRQDGVISDDDIEKIEEGIRITGNGFLSGGSLKNPEPYYCVAAILNYLSLLPKWTVKFLVKTKIYRLFKIKNYIVSTAFPRAVLSIFSKRDFRSRAHLVRFFFRIFNKNA